MIVRLRTNLGVTRLEVDATITIEELQKLILQNLHIVGLAEEVSLAADLVGNIRYCDASVTLESAGIVHGSEIFVLGKFEKRVVEKAFVGEDGVLVPAGQTLVRIDDVVKDATENASLKHAEEAALNGEAQTTTATPSASANPSAAPIPAPQDVVTSHPPPVWMNDYNALLDEQEGEGEGEENEEELRAPDEVRRVNLLGEGSVEADGSLMQAVLLPEEQEQIDQLERALREAGFREYDVHLETQQLQDQLIALRLQEEVAAHNTTHDALTAAFLAQHAADAAIHSHLNTIDATLARYHQQQRQLAAPDVLRLQQFQGVSKQKATEASKGQGATGNGNGNGSNTESVQVAMKPVVKAKPVKPVKPVATAPVVPMKDRASSSDAAVKTHTHSTNANTFTSHSRATATTATTITSINNSTNDTISSNNTTGKSIKGRNPSKLLTEAMKNLEAVAIDLPSVEDVLTSHHVTNNNTVPVPPRVHELDLPSFRATANSVKTTRPSMLQQTALRSLTAPSAVPFTSGDAMMETEPTNTNPNNRSYQPSTFTPHARYTNHTADIYHGEYGSSDILNDEDDEALLALLNPTRVTANVPATTTATTTGADRKVHANKPSTRTQAGVASSDNVPAGPALSLLGSGYKSMGQIRSEQHKQNAQQNTHLPLPAHKQKAPRSRAQPATTSNTTTHTVDTTTAKNSHKAKNDVTNKTELDVLDETLALALQLSLEHHGPDGNKPVPTKPSRAKKDTPTASTATKITTPSVQPSSQLKKNLFTRHPPSSSTGKAAERRQLQQRIVEKQALEDANRQLENDRRAAEDLQLQLDRETEATLLRQHLHANEYDHNRYGHANTGDEKGPVKSLPSWLQRKVDDGANEALMDLAAHQSFLYDQHREQQQQHIAQQQLAQQQQQQQQQQQRHQPPAAAAAVPVPAVARRIPARPEYIPPIVVKPAPVPVPVPVPPAVPVPVPIAPPVPALRAPLNRPYQAAQQVQHPHVDHARYNDNANDIYRPFQNNVGHNEMVADYMNMNVMYDEDDEMLARAIQESLNDDVF